MKILDLLINILKEFLYESIDLNGIGHYVTIKFSQRLDELIVRKQIIINV